jgi:hypothetical protein
MTVSCRNPYSWRRAARLATIVIVLTAAWVVVAHAQTPQPPFALFQQSTLTGSGNTITATQVPVVISSGITVYVNATLQFNVDSNGNLTLSAGFPQVFPAPALLTSSFKAGRYVGPGTTAFANFIVTVAGPGVLDGGATAWSLAAPTGASTFTSPSSATWYVGPIASNPLAARLKSAGITSTAWSYGVGSGYPSTPNWATNTLIGVSQIGNTLTIASFTNNSADKAIPVEQITYPRAPAP